MLSDVEAMRAWVVSRGRELTERVSVEFREGRSDVSKRSARIDFRTEASLAVAAVWESGKLEIEAVDVKSLDRFHVVATILDDVELLPRMLDQLADDLIAGRQSAS